MSLWCLRRDYPRDYFIFELLYLLSICYPVIYCIYYSNAPLSCDRTAATISLAYVTSFYLCWETLLPGTDTYRIYRPAPAIYLCLVFALPVLSLFYIIYYYYRTGINNSCWPTGGPDAMVLIALCASVLIFIILLWSSWYFRYCIWYYFSIALSYALYSLVRSAF